MDKDKGLPKTTRKGWIHMGKCVDSSDPFGEPRDFWLKFDDPGEHNRIVKMARR